MKGVWKNLKKIKTEMQQLNHKEFKGVTERVSKLRKELKDQQKQMKKALVPQTLKEVEKDLKEKLNKWSMIEESIHKQKFRVQWLKLGDSNKKFFYAQMKGRKA